MSGRETAGLEENAIATSAAPSSSAEMPASATVSGTSTDCTLSPYADFMPRPHAALTRQSVGAASRTCCACAGAAERETSAPTTTPTHRMQPTLTVDMENIQTDRFILI